MKSTKKTALAAAVTGLLVSVTAWAIPPVNNHQEIYRVYYSDAAHTHQVGVLALDHGSSCVSWHVTQGTQTSYSSLVTAECPTDLPTD